MTRRRVAIALALVALAVAAPLVAASSHTALVVGSINAPGEDGELTTIKPETTESLPWSFGELSTSEWGGYTIETSIEVRSLTVVVDSDVTASTARLLTEGGSTIETTSIQNDEATFDSSLEENAIYRVEVGSGGSEYVVVGDIDPTFPYSGRDIDVIAGSQSGSDDAWALNIEAVRTTGGTSESANHLSDAHSVERAEEAFVDISIDPDAHADYRIEHGGPGSWQTATSGTLSTTGNHSIDVSGQPDATQWRTNVTIVNETTAATTAEIHDEGIKFSARSPTASDFSPSDGETITAAGPTLSAEVTDSDFALAQGDEITAEFYVDDSQVGSDTLTSNGTATHSTSGLTGGSHDWHVELTDDYGLETTTDTRTFHTPGELRIYNESSPSTLVTDPVDVTVQFFADNGTVYERSTDDGVVDFTGLPVDREFTVTANPDGPDGGPNYQSRTIQIESLVEQQEIYLLNENVESANIVYTLVDNSGQFTPPEETTLYVEKALTINGQTAYRTVTSDQFSATNDLVATLEDDQRYRLRLEGPSGDTRVLGSYRTAGDDAATLTVGQVSFEGATASAPSFHANVQDIEGTRALRITYVDPANATDALTLEAVNRSDASDVIRPETTETGPFGQYSEVIPLSSSADDVSFNVSYEAERSGFADQSGVVFVGDLPPIAQNLHMDPDVLSALGLMTILGTLGLTAIARPRFAGIPTVVVAVGLVGLGVLVIHPLLLAGAGVIALLFAVGGGR